MKEIQLKGNFTVNNLAFHYMSDISNGFRDNRIGILVWHSVNRVPFFLVNRAMRKSKIIIKVIQAK